jgi:hypothetical protein
MFIIFLAHGMFFYLSILNKYEKNLSVLIPCNFSVLFIKMMTISNHNQIFIFYIFMFYNDLQLFLTRHVEYTSFICGRGFSKF